MKFVNPHWNRQIILEENKIPVLIIENRYMFRDILSDLKNQIAGSDGYLIFNDAQSPIKLSKEVEIILDYIHLQLNDKKILTKLYANLKSKSIEDYQGYSEIVDKISEYIQGLINDEDPSLVQLKNIDPIDLFKGVSLEIEEDNLSEMERLIEYVLLLEHILGIKVFLFINLKLYFADDEIKLLYDTLITKKITFMLIESLALPSSDSREILYICDADCCEI